MRSLRLAACCLCLAAVSAAAAADAGDERAPDFQPFLLGWDAGDGGQVSLDPKVPSRFGGGVVVRYEKVSIACEAVSFWLSSEPGEEKLLDRAELVPGPKAVDPLHVVLDSSRSRLPQIGFRGTMRPSKVTMSRRREASDPPGVVRYVLRLEDLDAFHGALRGKTGWTPVVAWARYAEVVLLGEVVGDRFGNLRIAAIHLVGEPSEDREQRRRAWLFELDAKRVSEPGEIDVQPIIEQVERAESEDIDLEDPDRLWTFGQGSTQLSLTFAPDGRYSGAQGGNDWRMVGLPGMAPPEKKSKAIVDE